MIDFDFGVVLERWPLFVDGAWLTVRLRRARGQGLANAVVDRVEGQRDGVRIALP